jgi:murein DD-endopeptidase MepM/ murein hydrolase activator NlpD
MDSFVRRIYFSVVSVLAILLAVMAFLVFRTMKPDILSVVSAPAPPERVKLQDFTPFFQIPGISFSLYHPVSGETYLSVAQKYNILETTLRSLNQANDLSDPHEGSPIFIPSKDGIFHLVRPGQGLADIARAYGVPLKVVLQANQKKGDSDLRPGEVLYLPGGAYLSQKDVRWIALASLVTQKGFIKPTTGRFADGFGYRIHPITHKMAFHEGLDLAPGLGARVVASQDGRVLFANFRNGYGRLIILDHGAGLTSWYAHLDEILVKINQSVKQGDLIGKVGQTGRVTGPHLHFEIRLNGKPQNPLLYLVQ